MSSHTLLSMIAGLWKWSIIILNCLQIKGKEGLQPSQLLGKRESHIKTESHYWLKDLHHRWGSSHLQIVQYWHTKSWLFWKHHTQSSPGNLLWLPKEFQMPLWSQKYFVSFMQTHITAPAWKQNFVISKLGRGFHKPFFFILPFAKMSVLLCVLVILFWETSSVVVASCPHP